jgi:hypothetical protein
MKMPFQTPVVLESTLPPDEVVRRLQQSLAPRRRFFAPRSLYPVRGRVNAERGLLHYRTPYTNIFQRGLRFRIVATATETRIEGAFVVRIRSLVGYTVWLGTVLFFCLVVTVPFLRELIHGQLGLILRQRRFFLLPYGLALLAALICKVGLMLSARTESNTLRFIETAARARRVPPTERP